MTSRTRIYLIRHGEIAGSGEFRYNGQADVPLTPKGFDQYRTLAERLKDAPVSACYTSDLSRCMEGAEILCRNREIEPQAKSALRELSFGHWEGMTWKELAEKFPEQWKTRMNDFVDFRAPGGENLIDLRDRVLPAITEIVDRHRGEEVLVVAHGGVNRIILLDALGAPPSSMFRVEQDYGCLNIIDWYADGNPVVRLLNG
jgi:alpha-ribazole phosphatase